MVLHLKWKARHKDHHRYVQKDHVDPDMVIGSVASVTVASLKNKSEFFQK